MNTKDKLIQCLIDRGILSENAITRLVPADGKFYRSESETQSPSCLLIKPNDEISRDKCGECLKVYWKDRYHLKEIPDYDEYIFFTKFEYSTTAGRHGRHKIQLA